LAEYGFTLSQAPGGLRIERGLLDLRSSSVVPGRVQGVVVVEPLLWRVRGWVRLEVTVAGYAGGEDSAESFATLLPIGPSGQAEAIVSEVLPGVSVAGVALTCAPPRARWLRPVGWRALAAGADDGAVVTRSGWLVRRTQVVPHAKIQSVRLRQGPLQRRLGLVDVVVDSPPGPVNATAKHRPAKMARGFAVGLLSNAQRARRLVRARDPSV
jgi:putative membrane protein